MKIKPSYIFIGLLLLLFLFINPITRTVIVFLLPLGSGWDDFVIIILGLLILVGFWTGLWIRVFELLRNRGK